MLKNQLLRQAQAKLDAGVKDRASYDKIVKAGTQVIYDKNVFSELTKNLRTSKDPAGDVAQGIVGVLGLLMSKSRGTMPVAEMLHAGMAMLLDALDFIEQAGLVKIDKQALAKATTDYLEHILPSIGMGPGKMSALLSSVKQTMADPQRMAQYKAHVGGQS